MLDKIKTIFRKKPVPRELRKDELLIIEAIREKSQSTPGMRYLSSKKIIHCCP